MTDPAHHFNRNFWAVLQRAAAMPVARGTTPLLMLILASCSGSPQMYTLTDVPAREVRMLVSGPAQTVAAVMPPIEVGQVSIPGVIDRDAIVVAAGGGALHLSSDAVWGAPLQEMIRLTLSSDLASRLPPGSLLAPGDPAPPGGLRLLLVNIQKFWSDTNGQVSLAADWTLTTGGVASEEWEHVAITTTAESGDISAVVPAMSRALGMMADAIAARLGRSAVR